MTLQQELEAAFAELDEHIARLEARGLHIDPDKWARDAMRADANRRAMVANQKFRHARR